jgi:translation initiation factor 2 beta subunit (eIF-2beta)/eIF-5
MNDFSHDELQQVIRKYDGEYKRLKKQAVDSA